MATTIRRKYTDTFSQFMGNIVMDLEELSSSVLGILLGIEPDKSSSLSFGCNSLSLQQKAQLIRDIRGADKTLFEKLVKLVEISEVVTRSRVKTLDQLSTLAGRNGRRVYVELESWCSDTTAVRNRTYDKEARVRLAIITLVVELKHALLNLLKSEFAEEGRLASFHRYNNFFIDSVLEQLKNVKLDVVGTTAATEAEKQVGKQLDEIGKELKKKLSKKR